MIEPNLQAKTTGDNGLPSVEEKTQDFLSDVTTDIDLLGGDAKDIHYHYLQSISQDRNQAYTSLVEGIEVALKRRFVTQPQEYKDSDANVWREGYNRALADILENVVKPLYGKE